MDLYLLFNSYNKLIANSYIKPYLLYTLNYRCQINGDNPDIKVKLLTISSLKKYNNTQRNNHKFSKTRQTIILPLNIKGIKYLSKTKYGKYALVNSVKTTEMLDNKAKCAEFISTIGISQIPTLTFEKFKINNNNSLTDRSLGNNSIQNQKLTSFINQHHNYNDFIIKESDSMGSNNISIMTSSELLNKTQSLPTNFIVQPYLTNIELYAIDCVCKDGILSTFIINKAPLFFKKDNTKLSLNKFSGKSRVLINKTYPLYNEILESAKKIIKHSNCSGIIEIEYLHSLDDDKLYFLEVNARLSGNIRLVHQQGPVFLDLLFIGYINNCIPKGKTLKFIKPYDLNNYNKTIGTYNIILLCISIIVLGLVIVILRNGLKLK